MNIKKFQIEYRGFGYSDMIAMQGNTLVFSSWHIHNYPPREVHIIPTEEDWRSFLTAIRLVVHDWRRKYDLNVCDGVCWTVKIETDKLKVNASGLHLFPENFAEFLIPVRRLIRTNEFASGFHADDFMSCTSVPHLINRRILRLMRSKRVKMSKMAEHLGYDPKELKYFLNSPETFNSVKYFIVISNVLGIPLADLMYESTLDEKPKRSVIISNDPLSCFLKSTSDHARDFLKMIHDN